MLKTLMTPTSDALPEIRAWTPMDAELKWKFDSVVPIEQKRESQSNINHPKYKSGTFFVKGFQRDLKCVWNVEFDDDGETKEGDSKVWYQKLGGFLSNLFFTSASPRAPPSMADPSFLLGKKVECEVSFFIFTRKKKFKFFERAFNFWFLLFKIFSFFCNTYPMRRISYQTRGNVRMLIQTKHFSLSEGFFIVKKYF